MKRPKLAKVPKHPKKNVKRKKQPKRKKRKTKCLGNVDFTPNLAYGMSGLFFPSEIVERRGGQVETHRSLKAECPGSILGGRQFFILISSVIYFFFTHFLQCCKLTFFFKSWIQVSVGIPLSTACCHSQTLRDSRCSSLCLAHGRFKEIWSSS